MGFNSDGDQQKSGRTKIKELNKETLGNLYNQQKWLIHQEEIETWLQGVSHQPKLGCQSTETSLWPAKMVDRNTPKTGFDQQSSVLKYCNLLFASKWTPVSQLVLEAWFVGSYHPGCYSRPLLTTKNAPFSRRTWLPNDPNPNVSKCHGNHNSGNFCNFEFNKTTWCCSGYQTSTQTWDLNGFNLM